MTAIKYRVIRMILCSESEHELKDVLTHMKQQTGDGHTNLRLFAKILRKMGKSQLAEQYLLRLLHQLPLNDPLTGDVYFDLGESRISNWCS